MGDGRTHALLISLEKAFSSRSREVHRLACFHEIFVRDYPVIDATQYRGLRDKRSELLHQVQSQRWSPETRLVIKSEIRIKTNGQRRQRAILCQQAVAQ